MSFIDNFYLCYLDSGKLFSWIKENHCEEKNFLSEKEKWRQEINQKPNFFSDTELLIVYQDFLLLKVLHENQIPFLAKIYQLEYQETCQKVLSEKKNIILISERQWNAKAKVFPKEPQEEEKLNLQLDFLEKEKLIVLWKDKVSIEKALQNWLQSLS